MTMVAMELNPAPRDEPDVAMRRWRELPESPWLWFAAFAYAGLAWLVVIGPKYDRRQESVERKFAAREEIARKRALGLPLLAPENAKQQPSEPPDDAALPPRVRLIVPLDYLMLVLASVLELALAKALWPLLTALPGTPPARTPLISAEASSAALTTNPFPAGGRPS